MAKPKGQDGTPQLSGSTISPSSFHIGRFKYLILRLRFRLWIIKGYCSNCGFQFTHYFDSTIPNFQTKLYCPTCGTLRAEKCSLGVWHGKK